MQTPVPIRVLVIDKSLVVCKVLQIGLQRVGYHVAYSLDPRVILPYLRRENTLWPHVLFLELLLPGLDGFEVLEELNAHRPEAFKDLTCIIISRRDHPLYRQEARSLGAKEYVLKPFSLDEIIALVQRHTASLHE